MTVKIYDRAWQILLFVGLASSMIISMLFFYPLYINLISRDPVRILFLQFSEPLEAVLFIEMCMCIMTFFISFVIAFFYARQMRKAPRF